MVTRLPVTYFKLNTTQDWNLNCCNAMAVSQPSPLLNVSAYAFVNQRSIEHELMIHDNNGLEVKHRCDMIL